MLRISLRDGEKVVVNGAVLRSVGRTDVVVENNVSVLRGREVMAPEEAITPARQLYFHTMMAYVDPAGSEGHQAGVIDALERVMVLLPSSEARAVSLRFAEHIAQFRFYQALSDCRRLIQLESEFLEEREAKVEGADGQMPGKLHAAG